MQLKPGSILQNGKYEIVRTLGQGGFGITYEAKQVLLRRKVAIKEFFMKDCCERDATSLFVTVGTGSQRALVEKFRGKFIREAQMIARLDNPNIVRVTDVFEENGTAYYVMDFLPGGSLADCVKKDGPLTEVLAEKYTRQVADALSYVHSKNTVHLDVKPSNILLNAKGDAVLIDFGISKHYDDTGEQTSSTPVGISKGYAPLEQSRDGDVSQFGPSTDIYALGATLYYLVTGSVPPEASIVNEDGLNRPKGISDRLWNVIEKSMQPRRKDRPQSIDAFLQILDGGEQTEDDEETVVLESKPETKPVSKSRPESIQSITSPEKNKSKAWLWALLACAVVAAIITAIILGGRNEKPQVEELTPPVDTTVVAPLIEQSSTTVSKPEAQPEPVDPGSVKVTSTPSGATIWLDGKNTKKTTPVIIEDLPPGKHSFRFVLEGYNDYSGSITIVSGKCAELTQTLKNNEKPVAFEAPVPVEKPTPAENPTTGTLNGHDWVDLGLSVKWATCNIGASSPYENGSLFAWGETSSKDNYSWTNLKYCTNDGGLRFSKYCPSGHSWSGDGDPDKKSVLDISDDAANQIFGRGWRTPTIDEFIELLSNCKMEPKYNAGKRGFLFTSSINGNSIFIPLVVSKEDSSRGNFSRTMYWSSNLSVGGAPECAQSFLFSDSNFYTVYDRYRFNGFPIRPVAK